MNIVTMTNEDAMYRAFRAHGTDRLAKLDRKLLVRFAGALIEQEEHFECLVNQEDLGEDATKEYSEQLEWIDVVYKAIDALLSNGESID